MTISVDPLWLLAWLLATVRALAWLSVVPPFSNRAVVPVVARIGIGGGLAILAAPHIAASSIPVDSAGLIGAIVLQAFTGFVLGLPMLILFSTLASGGTFLDQFGGLNLPASLDPLSENQTPLLGQLYEQLALALLFISGGALLVVNGFIASFGSKGLTLTSTARLATMFTTDLATCFVAALEMAAPIIAVLFAVQIVLALLAKAAPQMNVWMLGMPIQILIVLGLVITGIAVIPGFLSSLVTRIVQDMGALLGGA